MQSSNVDFLNIEYLLLRSWEFISNSSVHVSDLPDWFAFTTQSVIVLGMTLSFLFLILIVYAHIRFIQVEHALEQKESEEVVAVRSSAPEEAREVSAKNERWERIVELANSSNEGDWRRAILEADVMLGDMLTGQGYVGVGVGEQLRNANPLQMTTLDLAWKAHKVRNDVAHGGESYELSQRDVRATIDYYRRVFEEFGLV